MGRRYKHPPIVEAVCDFRFDPSAPWDVAVPGLVYEKIQDDGFPKRTPISDVQFGLKQTNAGVEQEVKTVPRIRFSREDGKAFVQVGPHQLTVHHLKPYPSWAEFQPLITKGFEAYWQAGTPGGIQRIGLRYINRIEIPGERVELKEYFEFYPFVGTKLPQDYGSFIVGIEAPFQAKRDILRLQLSSVKSSVPDKIAVLLDLDYFLVKPELSAEIVEISHWIDAAHERVEEAFENTICDPLRTIFVEEKK